APAASIRRTVPAATAESPGEDSFTNALNIPGGATLSARHNHIDQLASDDVAWLVLPESQLPRIALVHPDDLAPDSFLHDLVSAADTRELRVMPMSRYLSLDLQQLNAGEMFDLVVFDRSVPSRLPNVSTLTFGTNPLAARNT